MTFDSFEVESIENSGEGLLPFPSGAYFAGLGAFGLPGWWAAGLWEPPHAAPGSAQGHATAFGEDVHCWCHLPLTAPAWETQSLASETQRLYFAGHRKWKLNLSSWHLAPLITRVRRFKKTWYRQSKMVDSECLLRGQPSFLSTCLLHYHNSANWTQHIFSQLGK